jgi:hypothetical protein
LSTRAATKKSRTKIDKNLVKDLLKFKWMTKEPDFK